MLVSSSRLLHLPVTEAGILDAAERGELQTVARYFTHIHGTDIKFVDETRMM